MVNHSPHPCTLRPITLRLARKRLTNSWLTIITFSEVAPAHQRYLHRLEVPRRNEVAVDLHILVGSRNVALNLQRFPISPAKSQRCGIIVTDRGHSRLPLQLLPQTPAETVGLPRIITGRGEIEARQCHTFRFEARIHGPCGLETLQK